MMGMAVANFRLGFLQEVILFQSLIFFVLIIAWLSALWGSIQERLGQSRTSLYWMVFSLAFGVFLSVVFAVDWGVDYVFLAVAIGMAVGLALTHPAIAVCLQTSLLFMRPWELIEKNDYLMVLPKLTFLLCVAHVVLIFAKNRSIKATWDNSTLCIIAYAFWVLLTTFKSNDMLIAQFHYFDSFVKAIILYLMVMNIMKKPEELTVLQNTIVLTFLGVGAISIYQTVALSDAVGKSLRLRGIGAFSNSNDIAALMVLVFPFSFFSAIRKHEGAVQRGVSVIVLFVVCWSIYLSQSRGALIALLIGLGTYAAMRLKNKILTAGMVAGALAVTPIYLQFSSRDNSDLVESSSARMTYIKTGLMMGLKNPVFGVGFDSYAVNFERYATELLFEWGHRTAHNSWILAFAETGLLGFILFVGIFALSLQSAVRIFDRKPEFLVSLIGYAIAISFLSHTYLLYPYLLYGLIGVARKLQDADPASLAAT